MISKSNKLIYFLEMISCIAVVYYSNFLFFYLHKVFGFSEMQNLLVAALNGLFYVYGSWQGGKFSNKHGPIKSLYFGIVTMALTLLFAGLFPVNLPVQITAYAIWTIGVCFTWPAFQAIISQNAGSKLSTMVGLYNIIWAGAGAISFFTSGIVIEKLGMQSLFWLPLGIHLVQLFIVLPLAIHTRRDELSNTQLEIAFESQRPHYARKFLHMAWLANPFSYIAINTLIPLVPSISNVHGLSTGISGVVCSVWMFARLGAFFTLWKWNGWHYRFRWMVGAFSLMILSFAAIVVTHSLTVLILAQALFGMAIGHLYYSSLFYSMDTSHENAPQGGLHEAMLGTGVFVGPAIGATSLYFVPAIKNAGSLSVNGLLIVGLCALMWMGQFRIRHSSFSNDSNKFSTDKKLATDS